MFAFRHNLTMVPYFFFHSKAHGTYDVQSLVITFGVMLAVSHLWLEYCNWPNWCEKNRWTILLWNFMDLLLNGMVIQDSITTTVVTPCRSPSIPHASSWLHLTSGFPVFCCCSTIPLVIWNTEVKKCVRKKSLPKQLRRGALGFFSSHIEAKRANRI